MGRFISSSAVQPFTRAETFTTPGATSWTVPSGVNTAKVFVIGAGSCYRTTTFCFAGTSCCSGVTTPICNYCMNFVGHLPGAGGGYAEKTITDLTGGSTMTINVGSPTGLSASSISIGTTTVTATNGADIAVNWACTSNSTARDNSNDNPLSLGMSIPTCGYINCISGYFNRGGCGTGGDVNRAGGKGTFIPYFCQDSCVDYTTSTISVGGGSTVCLRGCTVWQCYQGYYDYVFGGSRYSCNCNVSKYFAANTCNGCCGGCMTTCADCLCLMTYSNVFGGQCYYNMPWASCICQTLRDSATFSVSNPASAGASSSPNPKYLFIGQAKRDSVGAPGYDPNESYGDIDTGRSVYTVPVGIGAEAGRSASCGLNGINESMSGSTNSQSSGTGSYADANCWGACTFTCCVGYGQDHFSFVFGGYAPVWVGFNQLGTAGASTPGGRFKCFNIAYQRDSQLARPSNVARIQLSSLKSSTGSTVTDFEFGYGATVQAAGAGGGGNRTNPAGGNGAVVIIY